VGEGEGGEESVDQRSLLGVRGAIECFLLIAFLACNLFHAFFAFNFRPEIRKNRTQVFWRSFMAAEIYAGINPAISP
jgi:hypothetical protein